MSRHAEHGSRDAAVPGLPGAPSRRSFLRLAGFGLSAAVTGCSRGKVERALAYLTPPEGIIPGRSYLIASTSLACPAGCGVLVRCRDGRPLKIEGNPAHPATGGGVCPSCQASILSLYDSRRPAGPEAGGASLGWAEADARVRAVLEDLAAGGGRLRVLTPSLLSPSTRAALAAFLARFPDARHVEYDALSQHALLEATARTRGRRVVPRFRLDRATQVVAVEADFLGTWLDPVGFARDWRRARDLEADPPRRLHHWQLESRMTLTGSKADRRDLLAPWEVGPFLTALAARIEAAKGVTPRRLEAPTLRSRLDALVADVAAALLEAGPAALLLCGSDRVEDQVVAAWIHHLLGAEGRTVDHARPSLRYRGDDAALARLVEELDAGEVDLLLVAGGNPAYEIPGFAAAMAKAGRRVVLSQERTETTEGADLLLPEAHTLERWDDAELEAGLVSLVQPTLPRLREGRTLRECLARWQGDDRPDRRLLEEYWRGRLRPDASAGAFRAWFRAACRTGWFELPEADPGPAPDFRAEAVVPAPGWDAPRAGRLGLCLYPKVGMLDGRNAHNAWLQELPDPVTKMTWDNYACLSPAAARHLGLSQGDVVRLDSPDGGKVELPVVVQPGQHDEVVAVALGYGRLGTDRFTVVDPVWLQGRPTVEPGGRIGAAMTAFLRLDATGLRYRGAEVGVQATGRRHALACTQDWHRLEVPERLAPPGGAVRDVARRLPLAALAAGGEGGEPGAAGGHEGAAESELWPEDHPAPGHLWGVAVDLEACTGCSACVISCQAENNVPVVGRDEVRRHREMSWLRLDRYWIGEGGNTRAIHQPMFCQHCRHAPCESVCPVLATVHSREGLNQQVYNRCVGTRYCANNCPYKVRRFNWFDYPHEDHLQNLALNPDVVVRSRGVMEKCSLCIQRIHEGRMRAREEGRPLRDGDIQLACQQGCPTRAIEFGDLNDPESRVAKLWRSRRAYAALGELNVRPSVRYLAAVAVDGEEEAHGA